MFYEAPHRILETLQDIAEIYGDREIVLTRELTKLHEEFLRGTALALFRNLKERESVKGEITLVIGKPAAKPADDRPVREVFDDYIRSGTIADGRDQSGRERSGSLQARNLLIARGTAACEKPRLKQRLS